MNLITFALILQFLINKTFNKLHINIILFICLQAKVAGTNKKPSLWKSYLVAFWPMIVLGGVYKLAADQLLFVGPMCLDGIVTFVMNYQDNRALYVNQTLPQV